MDFKIGYTIKPNEISNIGEVTFINNAGEAATYTESDCLAYNFIYLDSKCWSVNNSTQLIQPEFENILISGSNNLSGNTSTNSMIIGIENELRYNNKNNIIIGERNKVNNNISNTVLSGTKGESNYINSQILGGNQTDDILGERQNVTLIGGGNTTNDTYTKLYINDDGSTLFNVENNSVVTFSAITTAVRTGGAATGSKGDFKSFLQQGTVVSRGEELTIDDSSSNIASDGTHSSWAVRAGITGTTFYIEVRGSTEINLKWKTKIEISEMRTGIDLS